MEIRNRVTVTRRERGGRKGWEEEEGGSQGTSINDPWTWTTGWGLTVGAGGGRGQENNRGKIGTSVIEQ